MIGNGQTYKNHKLRRNHTNYRIGGNYMKTRMFVFGMAGLVAGMALGVVSHALSEKRGVK